MNETELEQEIKKAKRFNYTVFAILLLIILLGALWGWKFKYEHTFSTSRWIANPSERVKMVDDMLSESELIGKTKEEIFALLGEESGKTVSLKENNNLVYYLGDEPGLMSIDSAWLIITFTDARVSDFELTTD